jgi:predicted CXXCH cytochrome family protein
MSKSSSPSLSRSRRLALAAVLAAVGPIVAGCGAPPPASTPIPAAEPSVPPPPRSSSPYRNTTADARYVGSKACYSCHPGESDSYRQIGMGRAMADVVPDLAPPDGTVDHPLSGRRYEVYRKGGQLHHRELLRDTGTEKVVLSDYPVRYVIGSGRHALSYLVEADGFLVESPITWYTSQKKWGMSPSFDKPDQIGFERPTGEGCLLCHAGRAEAIDGSLHRMRFHELSIGCERCHGPGSLHLERQNHPEHAEKPAGGPPDDTIVNPKRLSRSLAEAVCELCHLQETGMVPVRGRRFEDFRPGLPVEEFRLDYEVRVPNAPMTVTGHLQQLRLSACYQKSPNFSCLTCHNPHAFPKPEERVAYYRAICQNCHEHRKPCTNPASADAANGCVKCHMPTGPTDIPHLAFTHHRIGLHPDPRIASARPDPHNPGVVRPLHDLSRFSEADRNRSLGIACLKLATQEKDPSARQTFEGRGVELVAQAKATGLNDGLLDSTVLRLSVGGRNPDEVAFLALKTLGHPDLPAPDRCDALYILANVYAQQRRYEEAIPLLNELNRLRRHHPYWLLLARCQEALGRRDEAMRAREQAIAINPMLAKERVRLAEYYEQKGDPERAAYHRRRVPAK